MSAASPPPRPPLREQPSELSPVPPSSQIDSPPTLQHGGKVNAAYEGDPVTAQYYRRFDDHMPQYPAHGSFSEVTNDDIRHIYRNSSLTEEVRERRGVVGVEVGLGRLWLRSPLRSTLAPAN